MSRTTRQVTSVYSSQSGRCPSPWRAATLAAALAVFSFVFDLEPSFAHTRITTDITWSGEIRAILRQRCMRCHSPGGIAPSYADFTSYGTDSKPGARAWATAIEEEILTGRMPPWDADPRYGSFANDRRLSQREVDMIVAWVQGGAPQGPRRNLPPPSEFAADSWLLGEPDLVIEPSSPHTLAGGAETGVSRSIVPLDIEDSTWITGYEFRPDNEQSVERMAAWILDPEDAEPESLELEVQVPYDPFRDEDEPEPTRWRPMPNGRRFVGQWLRGDAPVLLPDGAGKRLPAGARIELVVEYRRFGLEGGDQDVVDLSSLGLYLAQTEDEVDLIAESAKLGKESMKARGKAIERGVSVSEVLDENLRLVGLNPVLGAEVQSLEVIAHHPDDRSQTLLYVPQRNSEWPASYVFAQPLEVRQGTRLEMTGRVAKETRGKTTGFALIVDYTLDDHLVLPDPPPSSLASAQPASRGGMMVDLLDPTRRGQAGSFEGSPSASASAGGVTDPNPADPNAAAHMDHSPLHGGQFFMAPNQYHHLEGALPIEGQFYLYVYDDFKKPVDPRNFAGEVIFERYDSESGEFDEEKYPLEPVAGTDYLEARIPSEMPAEFFASVALAGERHRFDFYFDELSKDLPPAARPGPTYATTDHSHERPPLTIPEEAEDVVRELVVRQQQLEDKIESGDWLKLYVPAFDGRDLAEALLDKLDGVSARDRGLVRKAVSRVMQSAGELDRSGDIGDAARARRAAARFASGVRDMAEAILR